MKNLFSFTSSLALVIWIGGLLFIKDNAIDIFALISLIFFLLNYFHSPPPMNSEVEQQNSDIRQKK